MSSNHEPKDEYKSDAHILSMFYAIAVIRNIFTISIYLIIAVVATGVVVWILSAL